MSSEDTNDKEKMLKPISLTAFIFAFILVQLYFISPAYFIFKYKRKYLELKHIPFIQMFLNQINCLTYVVIAVFDKGDFQNLLTNIIGSILCFIVIIYLGISLPKNNESKNYIFIYFFILNIIFQIYYIIYKINKEIYESLTIVINVLMYLSINIGTYYAFKENKPDRIPILSASLGLFSSIGWTVYSATLEEQQKDLITLISNILSFIVLIIPIVCYFFLLFCHKSQTEIINQNNDKDINKEENNNDEESTKLELKNDEDIDNNNI